MVDTDTYLTPVNFPFIATAPDGVHTLKQGSSLVQVVPFRRADAAISDSIRVEHEQESAMRRRIHRNTLAGDGWYRRHARALRGDRPSTRV